MAMGDDYGEQEVGQLQCEVFGSPFGSITEAVSGKLHLIFGIFF
jgi:hypothetical protein